MQPKSERLASIAAALVLVIGMGFGRFAFTGLYPLMVASNQISVEAGSYAASANYAGYLVGALLSALLTAIPGRRLCGFATFATVATLAVLSLPLPDWIIVLARGVSGLASAVTLVAASRWLILERGHHHGAPALFSGVGVGILLSAEAVAAGRSLGLSSRSIWLVLAGIALALSLAAALLQTRSDTGDVGHRGSLDPAGAMGPAEIGAFRLVVIYGLAGFGYIITATYLPLLIRSAVASVDPVQIWAVFGLGAVPSCFVWHGLNVRWGTRRSLAINLLVQAVGVALPILHTPVAYILSALLVGGTFMGTVTIAMPAARKVVGKMRIDLLAIMTAAYGLGQIVGPLIANALLGEFGSFDPSLMVAAVTLVVAAVLSTVRSDGHGKPSPQQQ